MYTFKKIYYSSAYIHIQIFVIEITQNTIAICLKINYKVFTTTS